MEISKTAVLLVNEHRSDQKKCYKGFSYTFSLCNCNRKNDYVNGIPENVASRRILNQNCTLSIIEILSN